MVKQKTVHDGNHRKDASVTKKGNGPAVPQTHWEQNLNLTPAGIPNTPAGAFLPMRGRDRPQPHVKVNECDH